MDNEFLEKLSRIGYGKIVLTAQGSGCLLVSSDEKHLETVAEDLGLVMTSGADGGPAWLLVSNATPESVAARVHPPLNTRLMLVKKAPPISNPVTRASRR